MQDIVRELCRETFQYRTDQDIVDMEPPHAIIAAYNEGGSAGPNPDNLALDLRNTKSRWNKAVISILLGKVPAQQQKLYPTLPSVSNAYIEDLLNTHVRNLIMVWKRIQPRGGETVVVAAERVMEMQEETQKQSRRRKRRHDVSLQIS